MKENEFGITKEMILKIVHETSKAMKEFKNNYIDHYNIRLGNKLLSELLSKVFEVKCAEIFTKELGYSVIRSVSDADPDLVFKKINRPLEIKVTSTDNAWTGGEFSQRPYDYLLVSWDPNSNFEAFFVALVHLEKEDWESSMKKGYTYYGPSYTAKKLIEREDKIIFLGDTILTPRGAVKLFRENIRQKKIHEG
jgi:hypothetical protein